MKAAVIYENGGPEVLRYEEVPDPSCPAGCVVVAAEAISIEGGDVLARASSPPAHTPHVIGYLSAGTVVEQGEGVESPAIGDRVVALNMGCLLYTSDAADDLLCVDLGGRRIIKK